MYQVVLSLSITIGAILHYNSLCKSSVVKKALLQSMSSSLNFMSLILVEKRELNGYVRML